MIQPPKSVSNPTAGDTSPPAAGLCVRCAAFTSGPAGWVYKEWAGHFYAKNWPKKHEFRYYVRHFPTVEINATFYRLPTKAMVRGWHENSPPGFVFAVKGSRYLTHLKRLRDTGNGLRKYFRRLAPLGDRAGPILWQLPPSLQKTPDTFRRLDRFLARAPRAYRQAVEFRHPSWLDEETFALLRQHHAANVWVSSLRMPADHTITADFVYLRFHGLKGGAYHDYTDDELRPWARRLARAARRNLPAYVYFNNDLNTRASLNAAALMKLLGRHAVRAFGTRAAALPEIAAPGKGSETWRPWTLAKKQTAAPRTRRATAKKPAPKRRASKATAAERPPRRKPGRVIRPGQAGVRRFAAAQFSASALPPAR